MAIVFNKLTPNASSGSTKKYSLNTLTGSEWLRVAKVKDITKNIKGTLTIDASAEKKVSTEVDFDINQASLLKSSTDYAFKLEVNLKEYEDCLYGENPTGLIVKLNPDYTLIESKVYPEEEAIKVTVNNEYLGKGSLFNFDKLKNDFSGSYIHAGEKYSYFDVMCNCYHGDIYNTFSFSKISGKFIVLDIADESTVLEEITFNNLTKEEAIENTLTKDFEGLLKFEPDLENTYFITNHSFKPETDIIITDIQSTMSVNFLSFKEAVYEYVVEPLTFSSFNFVCGLNNKNQFISDVMPILQSPEIGISSASSGSSGDSGYSGSSEDFTGSGEQSDESILDEDIIGDGEYATYDISHVVLVNEYTGEVEKGEVTSITYVPGMTWEEWINSEYNTLGIELEGDFLKFNGAYIYYFGDHISYYMETAPASVAYVEIGNHEDLVTQAAKVAEVNFEEGYENSEDEVLEEPESTYLDEYFVNSAASASNASGSFGITAVTFEHYDKDIYICVLLNYTETDSLREFYADIKLENSNDVELLENIEVVHIDQIDYKGEGQLLEGMTFTAGKEYEFRLSGNLGNYYEGLTSEVPLYPIEIKLNDSYNIWKVNKVLIEDGIYEFNCQLGNDATLYKDDCAYMIDPYIFNDRLTIGAGTAFIGIQDVIRRINHSNSDLYGKDFDIIEASGLIQFEFSGGSFDSENDTFEVYINDQLVPGEFVYNEDTGNTEYHIRINNFTSVDKLEVKSSREGCGGCIYLLLDIYSSKYEVKIPVKFEEDFTVESYSILNNDLYNISIKQAEKVLHKCSNKYDLFSPYNRFERIESNLGNSNIIYQGGGSTYDDSYLRNRIDNLDNNLSNHINAGESGHIPTLEVYLWNNNFDSHLDNIVITLLTSVMNRRKELYINSSKDWYPYDYVLLRCDLGGDIYFTALAHSFAIGTYNPSTGEHTLREEIQIQSLISEKAENNIQFSIDATIPLIPSYDEDPSYPRFYDYESITSNMYTFDNLSDFSDLKADITNEVLNILQNDFTEVEPLDIGTSETIDLNSDSQVPTSKAVADMISGISGAGDLSQYALKTEIPTKTSQLTNDSNYAKTSELFSKNYNDLTNKPSIPTKTSELTNDSNYATTGQLFSGNYNDLSNKPTIPSKMSELTQDIELGLNEDDVLEIINNHAEEVQQLDIGTSETIDVTRDNQIPTSKAVADNFQLKLTAGEGITIDENNVISASGESSNTESGNVISINYQSEVTTCSDLLTAIEEAGIILENMIPVNIKVNNTSSEILPITEFWIKKDTSQSYHHISFVNTLGGAAYIDEPYNVGYCEGKFGQGSNPLLKTLINKYLVPFSSLLDYEKISVNSPSDIIIDILNKGIIQRSGYYPASEFTRSEEFIYKTTYSHIGIHAVNCTWTTYKDNNNYDISITINHIAKNVVYKYTYSGEGLPDTSVTPEYETLEYYTKEEINQLISNNSSNSNNKSLPFTTDDLSTMTIQEIHDTYSYNNYRTAICGYYGESSQLIILHMTNFTTNLFKVDAIILGGHSYRKDSITSDKLLPEFIVDDNKVN